MAKLRRNMQRLLGKVKSDINSGIKDWEQEVFQFSQAITPRDTGSLRASYLATPEINLSGITWLIKYGNGLVGDGGKNYAAEVHEWPDSKNFTTPGTGPRFLETAKLALAGTLLQAVFKRANF